jgi:hypothetical protein
MSGGRIENVRDDRILASLSRTPSPHPSAQHSLEQIAAAKVSALDVRRFSRLDYTPASHSQSVAEKCSLPLVSSF